MGVRKFENIGRFTEANGLEGYIVPLNVFEAMQMSRNIDYVDYDQQGRYVATDVFGETSYFFPVDLAA